MDDEKSRRTRAVDHMESANQQMVALRQENAHVLKGKHRNKHEYEVEVSRLA
jgi:hypothetical protein